MFTMAEAEGESFGLPKYLEGRRAGHTFCLLKKYWPKCLFLRERVFKKQVAEEPEEIESFLVAAYPSC